MNPPVPISAVLPAFDRETTTRKTVSRLASCNPPPAEIIVHFDAGRDFPVPGATKVIRSETPVGPGGGRNRLLREASSPFVASFDDDSFPVSSNFFSSAAKELAAHPGYAVYALEIRHPDEQDNRPLPGGDTPHETTLFQGCGCIYDRSQFVATEGYIPLPRAYGIEEIDLALRLHAAGGRILTLPGLAVFHDADLVHHDNTEIAAAVLANQALLAFLRYPKRALPLGIAQYLHLAFDQVRRGRSTGTLAGLLKTPGHLARSVKLRRPVPLPALKDFRHVTRHPLPVPRHG
jgi:GT2 family glycosyltransferase